MAVDFAKYDVERVLATWSVPKLAAGGQITSVNTGTYTNPAGTGQIATVEGINGQASTTDNYVLDGTAVEITPPVDSAGNVPDCLITFQVNGVKLDTLRLNGSMYRNMMPKPNQLVGGPTLRVTLGYPFQRAMQIMADKIAGRTSRTIANIPLEVTGIKVGTSTPFTITVLTKDGWGQNGTAIRPLRITLLGQQISTNDVPALLATYAQVGAFRVLREPFPGLSGEHAVRGAQTADNWMALPGGTTQNGPTAIYRKIVEATNASTISTSATRFVMSNLQSVGGTAGQVYSANDPSDTTLSDLGDLNSATAAFIWDEFGVDFDPSLLTSGSNPQVYVGIYLDATVLIPGNDHGRLINMLDNPLQYGAVAYQSGTASRFYRLPPVRRFANLLSWGSTVAPALSASGLTALNPGSMYVMKGGRQVSGQLASF